MAHFSRCADLFYWDNPQYGDYNKAVKLYILQTTVFR